MRIENVVPRGVKAAGYFESGTPVASALGSYKAVTMTTQEAQQFVVWMETAACKPVPAREELVREDVLLWAVNGPTVQVGLCDERQRMLVAVFEFAAPYGGKRGGWHCTMLEHFTVAGELGRHLVAAGGAARRAEFARLAGAGSLDRSLDEAAQECAIKLARPVGAWMVGVHREWVVLHRCATHAKGGAYWRVEATMNGEHAGVLGEAMVAAEAMGTMVADAERILRAGKAGAYELPQRNARGAVA
jgi:hypothetical protein